MKIFDHIRNDIFKKRLDRKLLVIYDDSKKQIFKSVAESLAEGRKIQVLDASVSSLEAREMAGLALRDGLKTSTVIYVPCRAPGTDEERMADPYAVFAEIGRVFPEKPADRYEEICKHLMPARKEEISKVFETARAAGEEPSFSLIDGLSGDSKWAVLRSVSGQTSVRELLCWILKDAREENLQAGRADFLDFINEVFGKRFSDKDRFEDILMYVWTQSLLTDFVAQRSGAESSEQWSEYFSVPEISRNSVINAVRLIRGQSNCLSLYKKYADEVERRSGIAAKIQNSRYFGKTFRAEERLLLKLVISDLVSGKLTQARECLMRKKADDEKNETSIWAREDYAADQWDLVSQTAQLLETEERVRNELSKNSLRQQSTLLDKYASDFYLFDQQIRRLANAVETRVIQGEADRQDEISNLLDALISQTYSVCRRTAEKMQKLFTESVRAEGWPCSAITDNAQVFDTLIAPLLQQQSRSVAFVVVDALRYEIGYSLVSELRKQNGLSPELRPACARFPTITEVGKATLLPGGANLELHADSEWKKLIPVLNGKPLEGLLARMSVLKEQYGDRFVDMTTKEFLGKKKLPNKVDLLVLRYDDIDRNLETDAESHLDMVQKCVMHLRRVVQKLQKDEGVKFTDIVIATDHGFVLNPAPQDGDKCSAPEGHWIGTHDRMLLGSGKADFANAVVDAEHIGISGGAFAQAAFPEALCAYSAGKKYFFHGGVSLQEAVVPVITLSLNQNVETGVGEEHRASDFRVTLESKKPKYTVLTAYVTVHPETDMLDHQDHQIAIQIYQQGDRTKTTAGSILNHDSDILTIVGNEDEKFKIRLYESDEPIRTIVVRAVDPVTNLELAKTTFEVETAS